MIVAIYIIPVLVTGATIYFVFIKKSREFLKFLAGAFFVSGGIQLYMAIAGVSIPILGTSFVQTPQIGFVRCIPHFVFFLLCLYFGFIRKPKDSAK